jgi:hypothetical protein
MDAAASSPLRRQHDNPELLAAALDRAGGFRVRERPAAGLGAAGRCSFVPAVVAEAAEEWFVVAEVAAVAAGGLAATLLRTVDAVGFRERTSPPVLVHSVVGAGLEPAVNRYDMGRVA